MSDMSTDAELAAIEKRLPLPGASLHGTARQVVYSDAPALMREVRRLRAEARDA